MCQLYGSVTTLYQCCISAALLSVPVLKMFLQRSATAQNVSEDASDTIACTVMSQKSKSLVSFLFETDAVARGRQDCESTQICWVCCGKDWETGTHSPQCLFWHFIVTYLCLYVCICRHIVPLSQHSRPPRY